MMPRTHVLACPAHVYGQEDHGSVRVERGAVTEGRGAEGRCSAVVQQWGGAGRLVPRHRPLAPSA